ncbi:hypothetical protein M0P65_01120 [Candidatus Gracilibacteria bacterium]|nr:hypothetical protein [Candidatus Gracilibacteria bacterium]
MTDALSSKLDEIQLEAERKKGGIVFIYSLIEDNLREYQGIFHTQDKDLIFNNLKNILESIIIDLLKFEKTILDRDINFKIKESILTQLGFTEYKACIGINLNINWKDYLKLTHKGTEIINGYLGVTGRPKIDLFGIQIQETRKKMLGITCSI